MARTLTWPWHGLIKGSVVQLPNGMTKPYDQPINSQRSAFGPGDTHLIVVPGVTPITNEEFALTPPGGRYWAGKALLSGNTLYNRQLDGWIYQALDGSRWRVNLAQRTIGDSSSSIRFSITRFGEFHVAAETRIRNVTVPVGLLPIEKRALFFADLGSRTDAVIKLHSVSPSGRNAVIAWCVFNTAPSSSIVTDTRPRAYTFAQVSLTGSGDSIGAQVTVLYNADDVMEITETTSGGLSNTLGPLQADVETGREPLFDEQGTQIGDTITYRYSGSVAVVTGSGWRGPESAATTKKWLVMLPFEGENPSPRYLSFTDSWALGRASFSVSTARSRIARVYYSGHTDEAQDAIPSLSGGASASGNCTLKWEGPGQNWSASVSYGASSSINGGTLTLGINLDGYHASESFPNSGFISGQQVGGEFGGDPFGRVPIFGSGMGLFSKAWKFSLYSNNLIGISLQINDEPALFEGVFTPDGFQPYSAAFPGDVRHFGSFNPESEQFVVGSPVPINWA